jgi:hypothetical protein
LHCFIYRISFAEFLRERLVSYGFFDRVPDQLIVNEYEVGQGIHAHIDKTHWYDLFLPSSFSSSLPSSGLLFLLLVLCVAKCLALVTL